MNPQQLYRTLGLLSLAGFGWLVFSWLGHFTESICLVKNVTGFPCPTCGTTRSLLLILQGAPGQAFSLNPLGFLAAILITVIPAWLLADLILKRETLFSFYVWMENQLRKKMVFITVLLLQMTNWGWSIMKEL